ncbi:MAG: hypothetical protein Q9227_008075 [Pyrenula ochraceoflavens]
MAGDSSSADLSSPPSDHFSPAPASRVPQPNENHNSSNNNSAESTIRVGSVSRDGVDNSTPASATANPGSRGARHNPEPQPEKIKRPRKKREPKTEETEKKPRKPRGSGAANSRKKQKVENNPPQATPINIKPENAPPKQSKLTNMVTPTPPPPAPTQPPAYRGMAGPPPAESGNHEAFHTSASGTPNPSFTQPQPPIPPPLLQRPSGHHYDPIRSTTISSPPPQNNNYSPTSMTAPPQPPFRPSASPAISSIIDPQPTTSHWESPSVQSGSEKIRNAVGSPSQLHILLNPSPTTAPLNHPSSQSLVSPTKQPVLAQAPALADDVSTAMEVDKSPSQATKPTLIKKGTSSGPTSNAASPKPLRAKEQAPPLPQGTGLISSALFGTENSSVTPSGDEDEAPTIMIEVPLNGMSNQIVNFSRMVEEKHGFAALHPRLAARKQRLAEVAAAGAAIEKSANGKLSGVSAGGSDNESMSLDAESDNDADIAMTGTNGPDTAANSGAEGGKKRRRRRKMEEYDQDDPFVDDSELAWEATAAASKDGFFVYSGPLVPEGEKPTVERSVSTDPVLYNPANTVLSADGTTIAPKRGRGRGRGGGPGSRGGRGAAAAAAASGETGTVRAGGPGSRGGTATRKPRVTKAGRALMERKKLDREKMGPLAPKPTGYPV